MDKGFLVVTLKLLNLGRHGYSLGGGRLESKMKLVGFGKVGSVGGNMLCLRCDSKHSVHGCKELCKRCGRCCFSMKDCRAFTAGETRKFQPAWDY